MFCDSLRQPWVTQEPWTIDNETHSGLEVLKMNTQAAVTTLIKKKTFVVLKKYIFCGFTRPCVHSSAFLNPRSLNRLFSIKACVKKMRDFLNIIFGHKFPWRYFLHKKNILKKKYQRWRKSHKKCHSFFDHGIIIVNHYHLNGSYFTYNVWQLLLSFTEKNHFCFWAVKKGFSSMSFWWMHKKKGLHW